MNKIVVLWLIISFTLYSTASAKIESKNIQPRRTDIQPRSTNIQPRNGNNQPKSINIQHPSTNIQPQSSNMRPSIEILDAWVRPATKGGNTALFMKVVNTSNTPDELISAHSDVSTHVEFHTHEDDNGVMRMKKIGCMPIPPHGNIDLKQGGEHVMLMNISRPLEEGHFINVTLNFKNSPAVVFTPHVKAM